MSAFADQGMKCVIVVCIERFQVVENRKDRV